MSRSTVTLLVLILCAVGAQAQQPATLTLRSGEVVRGEILITAMEIERLRAWRGGTAPPQKPEDPGYQGWWEKLHGLDAARAKTVEAARTEGAYLRKLLLAEFESARKPMPKTSADLTRIYASSLYHAYENLRVALGERGTRLPSVAWDMAEPGAAGSSAPTGAPAPEPRPTGRVGTTERIPTGKTSTERPSSGPSLMPLVVAMTAVDVARCNTEGKTWQTCATEFAVKAAAGVVSGTVITVVCAAAIKTGVLVGAATALPAILTATFVVVSGVTLIDLVEEASENISRMEEQRRNEARLNPAKIASIEASYRSRLDAAAIPRERGDAIQREVDALTAVVLRAREDLAKFRTLNDSAKLAGKACSDRNQNPALLTQEAERLVGKMKPLADAIERRARDARTLVVPCADVPTAKGALAMLADAKKDMTTLGELSLEARRDIADAVQFYSTLKAGRLAARNAAVELPKLKGRIEEARRAQSAIYAAVTAYATVLDEHTAARRQVYIQFRALKTALPTSPSIETANMLQRLDESLIKSQASALTTDRLNEIRFKTVDEVSRVEGLHRVAATERNGVSACGDLADDMPESLKQLLARLGQDITTSVQRGEKASREAADLPAKAQECLNGKPKGRDTRFSGTFALWVKYSPTQPEVQLGTMALRDVDQQRGREQAVLKLGDWALVDQPNCGDGVAGSRKPKQSLQYFEGEIHWTPSPFIDLLNRRPTPKTPMADARVLACSSSLDRIDVRFSGTEGRGGHFQLIRRGGFVQDQIHFDRGTGARLSVRVP